MSAKASSDHSLHESMVEASRSLLGNNALIDKDLRHQSTKSENHRFQPDVLLKENNIAVACLAFGKPILAKLAKYGNYTQHLILCVPIPLAVKEVWLFDMSVGKVTQAIKVNRKIKI